MKKNINELIKLSKKKNAAGYLAVAILHCCPKIIEMANFKENKVLSAKYIIEIVAVFPYQINWINYLLSSLVYDIMTNNKYSKEDLNEIEERFGNVLLDCINKDFESLYGIYGLSLLTACLQYNKGCEKAFKYLEAASELGDYIAIMTLANAYKYGKGVENNITKSNAYLELLKKPKILIK